MVVEDCGPEVAVVVGELVLGFTLSTNSEILRNAVSFPIPLMHEIDFFFSPPPF